jgi:hypothetical protein
MNFALLERGLNRTAVSLLGNASATWWQGGLSAGRPRHGIRVVFDRESVDVLDRGVNDRNPVISASEADMDGARRGDALELLMDGQMVPQMFSIVRAAPDGTGLLVLDLRDGGVA